MNILALDLSSAVTGWSILNENLELIQFGHIELTKYKKKKNPLEYIKVLYEEIEKIIQLHPIDKAVIEDTYARNISTIKSLCRIRGIAEACLVNNGIYDITLINAKSARKKAFQNGKLTSEECFEKLKILYSKQYKMFETKGFDIVDAIVLGLAFLKDN